MGYIVDYDALDQLGAVINTQTTAWLEAIARLEKAVETLSTTAYLRGKGADNAKEYIRSVYPSIFTALRTILSSHMTNYLLYKQAYQTGIDTDTHAVLIEEELTEAQTTLTRREEEADEIESTIRNSMQQVMDILSTAIPNYDAARENSQNLTRSITLLDQDIISVEDAHSTGDFGESGAVIVALNNFLTELLGKSRNYKQIFSGNDLATNQNYAALYHTTIAVIEDMQNKEENISQAIEQEQARAEILQREFEEAAAKQRKEEGIWKAFIGALTIVGGAAIIVATCGAATPIVVAGGVAGGSAIIYGAANEFEGVQDACYGAMGDIYTPAWNPIRDTVFQGNQDLYDAWGMTNVLVGGFVVAPLGVAYTSSAAAGSSFARAAVTEFGKQAVSAGAGYLSGEAGRYIGTEIFDENIGRYIGFGFAMLGGHAAYKGLSALDQNLNISGRFPEQKIVVEQKVDSQELNDATNNPQKPKQVHHYATNKSQKYTEAFKKIAEKYGLDLDDSWNKELLPHQGRHPNEYHEFVLDEMVQIDSIAQGNKDIFLELFEQNVKSIIRGNPEMLYKHYWISGGSN